ncbi:profilin [Fusarium longipes]|uniref:Profilin n=1 Tax=Fusarium longipes TaxID=694270 RepID=A0A395RGA1_9HYPO|nr:profilin [Fusarium longipes]
MDAWRGKAPKESPHQTRRRGGTLKAVDNLPRQNKPHLLTFTSLDLQTSATFQTLNILTPIPSHIIHHVVASLKQSSWFSHRREYRANADNYPHNSLVGSGHIDKGAIISVAGDSVWAASPALELKPEEMKAISAIVSGDENAKNKAFGEGLYLAGERYVMARAEDRSIYARSGRSGIAIAKTTQAIVVGHHGEAQVAGNATSTVEGLADYLIKSGY